MAKEPIPTPKPEPHANERFDDWSIDSVISVSPGEVLVPDDPKADPNKFANVRQPTTKK